MPVPGPPNVRASRLAVGDAIPGGRPVTLLLLVWIALAIVRFLAALPIRQPQVLTDELAYWQMAFSFHESGSFLFHGKPYDIPAVLYSVVLSPLFALHDLPLVFDLARLVNGFLLSSVVFPAYGLARELVRPRIALFVALLSGLIPGAAYSSLILAENLYYPLFCLAFWLAYRTLERGRLLDGGLAAGTFVVAYFTKPHLLLLAASYGIAVGLHAIDRVLRREKPREVLLGLAVRCAPLAGVLLAGALRFTVRSRGRGTLSPRLLFGGDAYAGALVVPAGMASPSRIAAAAAALILTLSLAVVFLPTARFIETLFGFRRLPRRLRTLLILSASALLIHLAVITRLTISYDTEPRVHERYLFVLSPALLLLPFALRKARWSARVPVLLLVVGFTVWLIGMHRVALSWNTPSDSPSLTGLFLLSRQPTRTVLIVLISTIVFGAVALAAG
ncbi:MAG TPA: glycosyltransferase family 39 protein, partial [Thermoanaerobaculia bacterium]